MSIWNEGVVGVGKCGGRIADDEWKLSCLFCVGKYMYRKIHITWWWWWYDESEDCDARFRVFFFRGFFSGLLSHQALGGAGGMVMAHPLTLNLHVPHSNEPWPT